MSKFIYLFILLFCLSFSAFTQSLQIEPYEFITRAKDTVQAELGTFKVREDRSASDTSQIKLSFVRFKSTNPNPSSPIVYLSGGPGGSGISTARGPRFELFMKLREVADVIALDQRGTGMSNNLPDCTEGVKFEQTKPIYKQEFIDRSEKALKECMEFWEKEGVNIKAYNTSESAADIDQLRQALGVDKISIWGLSYGSHLAFEYVRQYEENLHKLVLSSLEGPDHTVKRPFLVENFLMEICKRAKDNYGEEPKYIDLENKMRTVHRRMKENPIHTAYTNEAGNKDSIAFSETEFQLAVVVFYMADPDKSKNLPRLYTEVYENNYSTIAPQIALLKKYIFPSFSPMPFAMDIQSGISKERRRIIEEEQESTLLGTTVNFLQLEWMQDLGVEQLPDSFRNLKTNDVDALLLSGLLDGRTFPEAGAEIAKHFRNGTHITIDHAGHNLFMLSPQIGDLVVDFFLDKPIDNRVVKLEPVIFE